MNRGEKHMRVILFVCVFLFSLSCLFSIEDKIFDMEKIFALKSKTIYVYVASSAVAVMIAILYDGLLY